MPILVNKYIIGRRFVGIALWPFIVVKDDKLLADSHFINHERIHLRQQLELFIVFFYLWYLIEFLVRVYQYKDLHRAYQNISFEREAYHREYELDYLERRKMWSFWRYLKPPPA